ncbi:50S ribosomal protein L19 [Orientia tsutsugamushi]|uniref:Large ribosomal subunit protein bL19 n=5 Tax=Orientia tsutsugamushi TaxID=784 RepID=RL19_ORITI|nr:50S ribosomal protein L19 [Orientia tsutsugamushi]B3CQN9.1 RecName: Full=Large ribosomal subunit protein bL19; AltName: Full=50S ribosomal protein L19 [Orientia tsutsugamushi str. Ikeda]KJV74108.1 ribosomal protein L19 [Orientia tsutsugamushi str. UT76]KJV75346.1 ribosomal protein L19 [Orientia tsutsugamushi str. TA763]KJV98879.1 ribosomal protein L19 [Orientia tsutsugamushi str. Sido]KJV53518.1 ribosomal protein L19 [Orientia tsutsugamushi str. Gilliam]KJV55684.1 ribosomal protein L19 [Or
MNLIKQFEQEQIKKLTQGKSIPNFRPGDTVKVNLRIIEGANERIQAYQGVVIARANRSISSSFTVRKISHGQGIERKFMLYSPLISSIELIKQGVVRRAKLYYLRNLQGRKAKIREKIFSKDNQ